MNRFSWVVLVGLGGVAACSDDSKGVLHPLGDAGTADASAETGNDAASTTIYEASVAEEQPTSGQPDSTLNEDGGVRTSASAASSDVSAGSNASSTANATSNADSGASNASGSAAMTSIASESEASTTSAPSNDMATAPPVPPERWLEAAPLFTNTGIAAINIDLPEDSQAALRADSTTYVHGALQLTLEDGTTIALGDLGVRLKGRLGSARTLDEKCSFLLKSNEFVQGQRLLGMNKLALNNLVQDPSMLHEQLAYELFRAMDVPAPRTGFARVTVNGQLKGLYATIEVVDNAEFLDHWFPNSDGNLYEGSYGSDLETAVITSFDQDRGEDVAFADLIELTAALDQMTTPETFISDVEPWINLDAYVNFAATELFLSHWDGYASTRNNYFIYRPVGAQWYWIPWGTDQTFGDSGASVWNGNGRLQQMCEASLTCRQRLATAYGRLSQLMTELGLLQRVDALEQLISEAAAEDTAKEYETATVHYAIDRLRDYVNDRPVVVTQDLRCTDPSTVDEDEDGVHGCGLDCNDYDPATYPGAYESCNLVDDDCSGYIDDANDCPQCVFVADDDDDEYAFCFQRLTYWEAQAECQNMAGALVSIHDAGQQTWLSDTIGSLGVGNEWWVGLNDTYEEGAFRWDDGSDLDYTNWNTGEPNDWAGYEDCTELTWGRWNDLPCDVAIGYICQL